MRKIFSGLVVLILLVGALTLAFNIQPVRASWTIYIRADGSIDPPTAPISTVDNITYILTGNITSDADGIVIERDNTIVDGAGYTVQGAGGGTGIGLSGRSNVTINNITANNGGCGIELSDSSNNTIYGNNVTDNSIGIYIFSSNNNNIAGNKVTNNSYGIRLDYSSNSMLRNNAIDSNGCNFGVYGDLPSHFLNDVDASNTVDGKPVYYWINRQDMEIPSDCGCLALVNCTHITAKNLKITNNLEGILLVSTTNSTISGNNITANDVHGVCLLNSSNNTMSGNNITANRIDGIDLGDSSDNTMSENNITNSDFCGIQLGHSSNNTITGNNITNNDSGIELGSSSNNTITGNNITTNWLGIKLGDSSNNTLTKNKMANNQIGIEFMNSSNNIIYSNNFVDNTARQAYIYSYVSNNVWDNGYPSGGNYWSDYNGVDTNHDGLGDTQYIIDANNTDHYPLMNIIPEFPSLLILPLFSIATLLAVIIYKRKKV